jgi:hypothetical protein
LEQAWIQFIEEDELGGFGVRVAKKKKSIADRSRRKSHPKRYRCQLWHQAAQTI